MKRAFIKIAILLAVGFSPNQKAMATAPETQNSKLETRNLASPPPNWSVNAANFQYNMRVLARVKVGATFNNANLNMVGVFVGTQVRGSAAPIIIGSFAYYFISVYSNSYVGEALSFRFYLQADDKIYLSSSTATFQHNGFLGSFASPFLVNVSPGISITTTTVQPTCFGNANGSIFATALGGTPPLTYLWSNGKTTKDINLLTAGTYTLTVTDGTGATATNSTVLGQPSAISLNVGFVSNPPGYDAVFTTSGGTGGFLYNRTGMASTDFRVASDPIFDHLPANTTFIFKVKDANGCIKSVLKKTPTTMVAGAWLPEIGEEGEAVLDRSKAENWKPQIGNHGFFVFPNPTSNALIISFLNDVEVSGEAFVLNQIGQKVMAQNLEIKPGEEGVLDVGHLPQGQYFLLFRNSDGEISGERFLKVD